MFSRPMIIPIIPSELSPIVQYKAQNWTEAKILLVLRREGLLQKTLQTVGSLTAEYSFYLFLEQQDVPGYSSARDPLLSFLEQLPPEHLFDILYLCNSLILALIYFLPNFASYFFSATAISILKCLSQFSDITFYAAFHHPDH